MSVARLANLDEINRFFDDLQGAVDKQDHIQMGPITALWGLSVMREAKEVLEELYRDIPQCLLKDSESLEILLKKLERLK